MIPDREEFKVVYKIALIQKNLEVNLVDIKGVFNTTPLKLFTIIKVFKELSLLDFDFKYDEVLKIKSICINLLPKPDKKLNLNESKILNNLNELSKEYKQSY